MAIASTQDETSFTNDVNDKIEVLATDIELKLPHMQFQDPSSTWEGTSKNGDHPGFCHQMRRMGVIADEHLESARVSAKQERQEITIRSPSFQGVIIVYDKTHESSHERSAHIVSTHEQVLNGQFYVGYEMPAEEDYRTILVECGLKIGGQLAERGVVGYFSVDFLAIRRADVDGLKWLNKLDLVAVEINLRQGGTTHPYAAMEILVGGGDIDKIDGRFKTRVGNNARYYVETDSLKDPLLKKLSDDDLICAIESKDNPDARRLHWNQNSMTGTIFHLFKGLKSDGRIGFTSIGKSEEEAKFRFRSTIHFVKELAANKTLDVTPAV